MTVIMDISSEWTEQIARYSTLSEIERKNIQLLWERAPGRAIGDAKMLKKIIDTYLGLDQGAASIDQGADEYEEIMKIANLMDTPK